MTAKTHEHEDLQPTVRTPAAMRRFREDFSIFRTLWYRDMLRLKREPTRWLGVVLQPLVFWLLLGSGFGSAFELKADTGLEYSTYFFPGILVMIVLFTTIFATMSVIEDKASGFLQAVLSAPGSRTALVLGKVAGVTSIAMIQATIFLMTAPLAGYSLLAINWLLIYSVLLLACVGLTAFNMAIAWNLGSTQAYHGIMSLGLIPLWILSGAMFPPGDSWVATVMQFNPLSYTVDGVRYAFGQSTAGLTVASLSTALIVLSVFAIASTIFASHICRRR